MKESKYSNFPGLIFRETFNDEATVRKNGGEPTAVTFTDGKGTFDGSTSKINYNLALNGTYSVRIRCNPTSFAATRYLFDFRGSNNDGAGRVRLSDPSGTIILETGTSYVNAIATTAMVAGVNNEIIITGITINAGTGANKFLIGSAFNDTLEWLGTFDLVEIYQGTLTASEVSNLYNNKWNTELSGMGGEPKSNIVVNGGFDTDSDWTYNSSYVKIENGVLSKFAIGSNAISQSLPITIGKKYKVGFDITNLSGGTPSVRLDTSVIVTIYSNGHYNIDAIADGTQILFVGNAALFDLDNVTLQELNPKTLIDFDSSSGVIKDRTVGNTVGGDLITNGDFEGGDTGGIATGWLIANYATAYNATVGSESGFTGNAQKITITTAGGSNITYIIQDVGFEIGKWYRVRLKVEADYSFAIYRGQGTQLIINFKQYLTPTDIDVTFQALGTVNSSIYLATRSSVDGNYSIIDNVSVIEIRPDLSLTNVTTLRQGALFNGLTSKIDTGSDFIGTKSVTIMGWIKPYSAGEVNNGRLLENGKVYFSQYSGTYRFSSDGIGTATGPSYSINKWQFIAVTRTSTGIVNFYIGDKTTGITLSGIANQNSGTPVAGTTNVIIGNNAAQSRTFDGLIQSLAIYEGILDVLTIEQHRTSTLKQIK